MRIFPVLDSAEPLYCGSAPGEAVTKKNTKKLVAPKHETKDSNVLFLDALRLMATACGCRQERYEEAADKLRELAATIEDGAPIPLAVDDRLVRKIAATAAGAKS